MDGGLKFFIYYVTISQRIFFTDVVQNHSLDVAVDQLEILGGQVVGMAQKWYIAVYVLRTENFWLVETHLGAGEGVESWRKHCLEDVSCPFLKDLRSKYFTGWLRQWQEYLSVSRLEMALHSLESIILSGRCAVFENILEHIDELLELIIVMIRSCCLLNILYFLHGFGFSSCRSRAAC